MRRLLAAAVAAALFTPAQALAIDPPCEITGQVLNELNCDNSVWDPIADVLWNENIPNASASPMVLGCTEGYGTLPGTTTPTAESGSAACLVQGGTVSTSYSVEGNGTASRIFFSYRANGGGTLASSSGTFEMRHNFYDLYIAGTYTRAGAVWTFTGTEYYRFYGDPALYTGPFVATGAGLPAQQAYQLAIVSA